MRKKEELSRMSCKYHKEIPYKHKHPFNKHLISQVFVKSGIGNTGPKLPSSMNDAKCGNTLDIDLVTSRMLRAPKESCGQ